MGEDQLIEMHELNETLIDAGKERPRIRYDVDAIRDRERNK